MSLLWMCLSLLYAASFLLSGASSDQGVSLGCNQTVEVAVGETAILNCSISCATWVEDCNGESYFWRTKSNTNGPIACNSDSKQYKCEWDNKTYVSLTISNITKEENYTIGIETDRGQAQSSVKVQIIQSSKPTPDESKQESTSPHVAPAVLSIFVALVCGILYFLFGNGRGRKIIKCTKKEKTHGHSCCMDTAGEGKTDCLTNSEISV